MRPLLLFLFCLLEVGSTSLHAQIKLLKSSSQNWVGGIAGRSGVNYSFTFEAPNGQQALDFDTLWIGFKPIPLAKSQNGGNVTIKVMGKSNLTDIAVKTIHDESALNPAAGNSKPQRPPIAYNGAALRSITNTTSESILSSAASPIISQLSHFHSVRAAVLTFGCLLWHNINNI